MIRWTATYTKFRNLLEWAPEADVWTISIAAGFLALAHVGAKTVLFLAAAKPASFDTDFPNAKTITSV